MNKINLKIMKDGEVVSEKVYNSLKLMHDDYPEIQYHQLRAIWMKSTDPLKANKKLHKTNSKLCETMIMTEV
jgi:hypothetical protein